MVSLPPRLLAVADLVPSGARVVDVGTDHGRLPVYLVQRGLVSAALATDISPGPLRKARRLVSRCGLKDTIALALADGLGGLPLGDLDVAVIAGLGADTIIRILRDNPPPNHLLCLFQPMSHTERLRDFLGESAVTAERLAMEGRRIYSVIAASPPIKTHSPATTFTQPGRRYLSRALECGGDALLPIYLDRQITRLAAELAGLEARRAPGDATRRNDTAQALAYLIKARKQGDAKQGDGEAGGRFFCFT